MYHDGSSGGVVRIGNISQAGVERQIFYAPIDPIPETIVPAVVAV